MERECPAKVPELCKLEVSEIATYPAGAIKKGGLATAFSPTGRPAFEGLPPHRWGFSPAGVAGAWLSPEAQLGEIGWPGQR
jgi:hypothetical protein